MFSIVPYNSHSAEIELNNSVQNTHDCLRQHVFIMSINSEFVAANATFVSTFKDGDKPMPPARHAVRSIQLKTFKLVHA